MIRPVHCRTLARAAALLIAFAPLVTAAHAQNDLFDSPTPTESATPTPDATDGPSHEERKKAAAALAHSLNYRQGNITLQNDLAKLDVPDRFRFLDASDARKVVVELWGNPPDAASDILGMLVPASLTPDQRECWGVIITYEESGYVKDDDAAKIDYTDLLKKMQQATRDHNEARTKAGYEPIQLIGWAAPPRYDAATKKMYWAKEIQFGDEPAHTLNYDVRILGRRGVLRLATIAHMDQLAEIKDSTPDVLAMVNYNQGHRYADFNPKTDKVATYGLATLVAGGILAKVGGFKLLLAGLLAAKKFLVVGAVAAIGFFKRIFGRGERQP